MIERKNRKTVQENTVGYSFYITTKRIGKSFSILIPDNVSNILCVLSLSSAQTILIFSWVVMANWKERMNFPPIIVKWHCWKISTFQFVRSISKAETVNPCRVTRSYTIPKKKQEKRTEQTNRNEKVSRMISLVRVALSLIFINNEPYHTYNSFS